MAKQKKKKQYGGWEPPEGLMLHSGDEIPNKADFFIEPPEEIGELASVCTTMTTKDEPTPLGLRLLLIPLLGALGAGIGIGIDYLASVQSSFWWWFWPVGLGLLGAGITWASTGFQHTCTYVGEHGIALAECKGRRDRIARDEVFLFREAAELRTTQTRHYTNGVYQRTEYRYTWTDVGGRQRYVIRGQHNSEAGVPDSTDLYHFATAAEVAWSQSLLEECQRQIMTKGEVRFNLKLSNNSYVAVGEDYLRLCLKGAITERDVEDIESVTVDQGMFKVKEIGAKEGWFSSKGVFTFKYENLANAQLFMFVLDKVLGIRVE